MDPDKLTQKSQEALHDAQTKALRFGHTEVDVDHLLVALLDQPDGLVRACSSAPRSTRTRFAAPSPPSSSAVRACRGRAPRATSA